MKTETICAALDTNAYYKRIYTLIDAWVVKNNAGYRQAWGMLIDAYHKAHGVYLDESVGETPVELYDAVEQRGCAKELHGMAIDLFIKNEGNTDERKSGI